VRGHEEAAAAHAEAMEQASTTHSEATQEMQARAAELEQEVAALKAKLDTATVRSAFRVRAMAWGECEGGR